MIYSANWVLVTAAAALMFRHVVQTPGLLDPDVSDEGARRLLRTFQVASVAYAVFTVVAAFSAVASIACYGISAVYFLLRSDYRALGRQTVEESAG